MIRFDQCRAQMVNRGIAVEVFHVGKIRIIKKSKFAICFLVLKMKFTFFQSHEEFKILFSDDRRENILQKFNALSHAIIPTPRRSEGTRLSGCFRFLKKA